MKTTLHKTNPPKNTGGGATNLRFKIGAADRELVRLVRDKYEAREIRAMGFPLHLRQSACPEPGIGVETVYQEAGNRVLDLIDYPWSRKAVRKRKLRRMLVRLSDTPSSVLESSTGIDDYSGRVCQVFSLRFP